MMDESTAEAMQFGNNIAVKDELTCADILHQLIDAKQSTESSHAVESLPFEEKVQKSDSIFEVSLHATDVSYSVIDCCTKRRNQKSASLSPADERRALNTIPSPPFKLLLSKDIAHEKIAFNREYKKLEKVWSNRGLPVDKETICSAASKDAFDLEDLSKSLPSTSASVNEPTIEIERGHQVTPKLAFSQLHHRLTSMTRMLAYACRPINPKCSGHATHARLPASETSPLGCQHLTATGSLRETARKDYEFDALRKAQAWSRIKRRMGARDFTSMYMENLNCSGQKDARKDTLASKAGKVFWNMNYNSYAYPPYPSIRTSEESNFSTKLAEMSIDDKPDEKRNSDDENFLPVFNPPRLSNYVSQLGLRWPKDEDWTAKIDFSDTCAPSNSPIKKEENAVETDPFWAMEKTLAEIRKDNIRLLREQNKLKTLNSHRGIFPEDEDEGISESEKPFSVKPKTIYIRKWKKVPTADASTETERIDVGARTETERIDVDASTETERLNVDASTETESFDAQRVKRYTQMLRKMKESIKNVRVYRYPCTRSFVKYDKVVPD